MRKFFTLILMAIALYSCGERPVEKWSDTKVEKWYDENPMVTSLKSKLWEGTNKRELARQWQRNPEIWQAVFDFLNNPDLDTLAHCRHDLTPDGTLYANISEYETKSEGQYEVHRKYIDIHYVVLGSEITWEAPLERAGKLVSDYDPKTECAMYADAERAERIELNPQKYCILFPGQMHKPGMTLDKTNRIVKVVVKVPYSE